jgi:hypothetical protein
MNKIPEHVSSKILATVHERLHPNLINLTGKLFLVHLLTAVITLSVCPQFGFKIFKLPINLMNHFMVYGMPVCNFLCGLFFTTTSMIVASFVLRRDEVRALRYKRLLVNLALLLSSIGFFGIMNPNLFLEFSLLWLLGAVMGITLTLEAAFSLSQN